MAAAYQAGEGRQARLSTGRARTGHGMLDGDLAAGLQEALRERFAVELPRAAGDTMGGRVRIRHELIAAALATDLLPDQRRRMHAALATALAVHPAEAARHWLRAYEPARARAAALQAAATEESAGADADALRHLELAIELAVPAAAALDDAVDHPDVALLRRAAEAALAAGDPGRAAAFAESALAPGIPSGDRVESAAAWDRLGVFRWESGDREAALGAHAHALELLPRTETAERARVLATLAQIRMLEGSFNEAEHLAAEALTLAESSGPSGDAWLGHALCTLGVVDGWLGRPTSAEARLERALAIAVRLDRLDDAFRARANLATILDLEGRREEALQVSVAGIAAAEAAGLEAVYGNRLRGGAVDSLFQLGRWREARALAMHALAWAPAGIAFVHAAVGFITVETELSAGEDASRTLGRLLVELELISDTQFAVPTYQAAASLALWRGDPADARRVADVAWDRVRTTEDWVRATDATSRRSPRSMPGRMPSWVTPSGWWRHPGLSPTSSRAARWTPSSQQPGRTCCGWSGATIQRPGPPSPSDGSRSAIHTTRPVPAADKRRRSSRAGPPTASGASGARRRARPCWRRPISLPACRRSRCCVPSRTSPPAHGSRCRRRPWRSWPLRRRGTQIPRAGPSRPTRDRPARNGARQRQNSDRGDVRPERPGARRAGGGRGRPYEP